MKDLDRPYQSPEWLAFKLNTTKLRDRATEAVQVFDFFLLTTFHQKRTHQSDSAYGLVSLMCQAGQKDQVSLLVGLVRNKHALYTPAHKFSNEMCSSQGVTVGKIRNT